MNENDNEAKVRIIPPPETSDVLFDALGRIGEDLLTDARPPEGGPAVPAEGKKKRRLRALRVWLPAAACFLFVAAGVVTYLVRMGYFGASMGSSPGYAVGGAYWYSVAHDGLYVYENGVSERRVSRFLYDDWLAGDGAVWYRSGKSIWVLPHGERRAKKIYTAPRAGVTHIRMTAGADGSLIVTLFNKKDRVLTEVRVDGMTGQVLETVTPRTDYGHMDERYSLTEWTLGARRISLRLTEIPGWGSVGRLYEDGEPLTAEGPSVSPYPLILDGAILFTVREPYEDDSRLLVLRADGEDSLIPDAGVYLTSGGPSWLFGTEDGQVIVTDARTGETAVLPADTPHDFCDLVWDEITDGEGLLYASEPWGEETTLWRVVFADGVPASLVLIDEDIRK